MRVFAAQRQCVGRQRTCLDVNLQISLALSVLALTSLVPLVLLDALVFVAASIDGLYTGNGDTYVLSLRILVTVLLLWTLSPAVAAIVAKRAGLLTGRAAAYWLMVWGGTTSLVLFVLTYWRA